MAYFGQSDEFRRDELIRIIEHSVMIHWLKAKGFLNKK